MKQEFLKKYGFPYKVPTVIEKHQRNEAGKSMAAPSEVSVSTPTTTFRPYTEVHDTINTINSPLAPMTGKLAS